MNHHLLTAALDAARHGWPVIPLRPGRKYPALHGEDDCPRTGDCTAGHRKWEQRATTDPDRIRTAWTVAPYNIGLATGPAGLVVIDLDMPKTKGNGSTDTPSGVTTFRALCERAGHAVPTTYTVRTAGGGLHLYFTAPAGARLSNTASSLGPLIDTRAHGGYVVAAGSVVNGRPYERITAPVAPLPEWLYADLTARQSSRALTAPAVPHRGAGYAAAVFTAETAAVATANEGGRNTELLRAVRAVGRFVAWGDLDRATVEAAFQAAGESAGLPASECRATIRSALDWSIRTARARDAA
ncbi:bifunctional DNA primase/polymerase [Streptomyces sp. CA-111067]|uniref:bifunctional DNA primase/polymerase n=1 Tax=Streptomyces sp. CA-111067 TaxID=3240046 RepID=UPI003D96ECB1